MGCDIHWHSEIKVDGVWHHHSAPRVPRDYWLFALLAGVRNYENAVEPISKPRGLPDDISVVTKLDRERWGADGHSDSYISSSEMKAVHGVWREKRGYSGGSDAIGFLLGNYWSYFTELREDEHERKNYKKIEDVRWVFWFDN
jgi:hypothetical protein